MFCANCGKLLKRVKKDYHYTESGLKNIILANLTIYQCSCGEEVPLIPHAEELHKVIAFELVKSKSLLSGPEVRFLRKQLGMKAVDLAEMLGVSKVTVSRWENGEEKIGAANDRLIKLFLIKKMEEELKSYLSLKELHAIFSNIPRKQKSARITIPVDRIADYNYGLVHC